LRKINIMDQPSLISALADLNLPEIRFFESTGSTNDEARNWIEVGAPHKALVVADEQTAGRGRLGRRWYTPPGTALAFSLALLSPPIETTDLSRLTGLGAWRSRPRREYTYLQIKWPKYLDWRR
jgi:BirA family biotin operon repressor/biotin-[acetyl-CoA-carboxylase] ligase